MGAHAVGTQEKAGVMTLDDLHKRLTDYGEEFLVKMLDAATEARTAGLGHAVVAAVFATSLDPISKAMDDPRRVIEIYERRTGKKVS